MPNKPITKKQQQVLTSLRAYRRKYGYSPTIAELCNLLKLSAINTVYSRLLIMEKHGWLKRDPNLTSREFLPADEPANRRTTTTPKGEQHGDGNG